MGVPAFSAATIARARDDRIGGIEDAFNLALRYEHHRAAIRHYIAAGPHGDIGRRRSARRWRLP
jgi:hypothetical protein